MQQRVLDYDTEAMITMQQLSPRYTLNKDGVVDLQRLNN